MSLSRIATIITAGLSSAASFYILTRSGLAGTLVGALVSGVVYNVTSLGLNHGLSKSEHLLKPQEPQPAAVQQSAGGSAAPPEVPATMHAAPAGRTRPARWLPMALGAAALLISIWAVVDGGGSTLIRERIVEQPVVKEKIVVQTVTVTVAPGPTTEHPGGAAQPAPQSSTTETSIPTTTTYAPSTSTTVETPTTTSTVQAPSEGDPTPEGTSEEPTPSP